jgi:hypothetical protein
MRLLGYSMVLGLGMLGCGGDDDGKSKPQAQCEEFADTWCEKALGCYTQVGRLPASQTSDAIAQCSRALKATFPCEDVVAVGSSFSSCLSGIKAMDCAVWDVPQEELSTVHPPDTCTGVLMLSP